MSREIKIALAGNPNSGKTTLFNALTGSNQYVGNWPGVTVEKKEGQLKNRADVKIEDLPGVYSLSPYTSEEVVARDYLLHDNPDVILNIVDASNLERNLYLTSQLMELEIPMVIALNMMDVVAQRKDKIQVEKLQKILGCPIVTICALKGSGIEEAAKTAIQTAKAKQKCKPVLFSEPVEEILQTIQKEFLMQLSKEKKRWYSIKLFERDSKIEEEILLEKSEKEKISKYIEEVEKEYEDDAQAIITNERYQKIASAMQVCYQKKMGKELTISDRIDRIVTNRLLALPIFAAVMFLVYYISVSTIGAMVTDFTNDTLFGTWIQPAVHTAMKHMGISTWLISLVVDGIIGGLAAPIGFAPQMAIVFLFLALLEDCGYMARVAFIMDRIFRRFGLSGKSFIPFLIASGCGVPGIMATRTIENEKDRRMTMMTTTCIPCGAKLPVIALIAGFLMKKAWWMAPLMYFMGIVVVICSCIILKKMKIFSGEPAPFVMELPQYHLPALKGVCLHVWERVWAFLKKAGTILFLCCVVMWFLGSFGIKNGALDLVDTKNSFLALIGSKISFLFIPLGFGTWQAVASSLSGFVAKEGIVSTMGVLTGVGNVENDTASLHTQFSSFFPTQIAAVSFLLFNLFDSPCLVAISTMAREMGSKKFFWFAILFQNVTAYSISLMVYQLVGLAVHQVPFTAATLAALVILGIFLYLLLRADPYKKTGRKAETAL